MQVPSDEALTNAVANNDSEMLAMLLGQLEDQQVAHPPSLGKRDTMMYTVVRGQWKWVDKPHPLGKALVAACKKNRSRDVQMLLDNGAKPNTLETIKHRIFMTIESKWIHTKKWGGG